MCLENGASPTESHQQTACAQRLPCCLCLLIVSLAVQIYDLPKGVEKPSNVELVEHEMPFTDLRRTSQEFNMHDNGFTLVKLQVPDIDWDNEQEVGSAYTLQQLHATSACMHHATHRRYFDTQPAWYVCMFYGVWHSRSCLQAKLVVLVVCPALWQGYGQRGIHAKASHMLHSCQQAANRRSAVKM